MSKLKCIGVVAIALLVLAASPPAATDLRLRAEALDDLYAMDLPADKLHALAKLASGAAQKPANVRLGPNLHKALNELCDALAKSDDDHIDALQEKVDQLEENANIDDPMIEPTDAAKRHVVDVLKLLTPTELANLIAQHSDEIDSPADVLIAAMDDQRGDSDDDFKADQSDTVLEVVELSKGFEGDKRLADQAGELLTKAHKLDDANFKSQKGALEADAHKICGRVDSFTVIHNWTMRELAELLSNPELPAAIELRLKNRGTGDSPVEK